MVKTSVEVPEIFDGGNDNGVQFQAREDMKWSICQEMISDVLDPAEANERYDEFDTINMPLARSASKSPLSDEGIEPDTERRRASVARCWSLDSPVPSDEDVSQLRRHKPRVTRCCSSDSAVLSDEDQNKGEFSLIDFSVYR